MYRGEITEKAMPAAPIPLESPEERDEYGTYTVELKKKTRGLRFLCRGPERNKRCLRYLYRGPEKTTRCLRYLYRGPEQTPRWLVERWREDGGSRVDGKRYVGGEATARAG